MGSGGMTPPYRWKAYLRGGNSNAVCPVALSFSTTNAENGLPALLVKPLISALLPLLMMVSTWFLVRFLPAIVGQILKSHWVQRNILGVTMMLLPQDGQGAFNRSNWLFSLLSLSLAVTLTALTSTCWSCSAIKISSSSKKGSVWISKIIVR